MDFDELRIGTTWADVTPAVSNAPNADFDSDGDVDGGDFLTWQRNFGIDDNSATLATGDANGDGNVTDADFAVWTAQFGTLDASAAAAQVPEPSTALLLLLATMTGAANRRFRTRLYGARGPAENWYRASR